MTLYIVSALVLIAAWHILAWRLDRVVTQRIEMAVTATGQRFTCGIFACQARLTDDQRRVALAHSLAFTDELLGRWNRLLLRIALLRWDLTGWLTVAIESRVYRLKSWQALPVSQSAMMARNPETKLIAEIGSELLKLCAATVQRFEPRSASNPTNS